MAQMKRTGDADQPIDVLAGELLGCCQPILLADHQLINEAPLDRFDALQVFANLGIELPCCTKVIGFSGKAHDCYLDGMFHALLLMDGREKAELHPI